MATTTTTTPTTAPTTATTSEDDLEKWKCPICMDVLCKPIVASCGHIFCFWCVHRAMDGFSQNSKCPLCRQTFNHLPDVCEVLHGYIARTFPKEYAVRLKENLDEEEELGAFSPDPPPDLMVDGSPIAPRVRSGAGTGAGEGEREEEEKEEEDGRDHRAASPIPLAGRALLDALEQQAPRSRPDPSAFACGFSSSRGVFEELTTTTTTTTTGEREAAAGGGEDGAAAAPFVLRNVEGTEGGHDHVLWEPLVLTCGHAVCKGCHLRRLRVIGGSARTAASVARLRCPVCRRRVIGKTPPEQCKLMQETIVRAFGEVGKDPAWRAAREAEWTAAYETECRLGYASNREEEEEEEGGEFSGGGEDGAVNGNDGVAEEGDPESVAPLLEALQQTTSPSDAAAAGIGSGPAGGTEAGGAAAGAVGAGATAANGATAATRSDRRRPRPPNPHTFTHHGVGCDVCGVYPIVGRRFRCLDCPEAMGFDLCRPCHFNTGGSRDGTDVVRGRFNQNHRPEHRMQEVVPRPTLWHMLLEAHPELSPQQLMHLVNIGLSPDNAQAGAGAGGAAGVGPGDAARAGDGAGAGDGAASGEQEALTQEEEEEEEQEEEEGDSEGESGE